MKTKGNSDISNAFFCHLVNIFQVNSEPLLWLCEGYDCTGLWAHGILQRDCEITKIQDLKGLECKGIKKKTPLNNKRTIKLFANYIFILKYRQIHS